MSNNNTLINNNKTLQQEVKRLNEIIQKLTKGKSQRGMSREPIPETMEELQPPQNVSQSWVNQQNSGLEDKEGVTLSDIIQTNPQRAKEMMIAYKKEVNFLRNKLRSLKIPI
jgi:hypothetical protein